MTEEEQEIKEVVRKLIYDLGGEIQSEQTPPGIEFSFQFKYLKRPFMIVKSVGKDWIEISTGTDLSKQHKKIFDTYEQRKRISFINDLIKKILFKNLEHKIIVNPNRVLFVIFDKVFFKENIPINILYKSLQSVFSCTVECVLFVQEHFGVEIKLEDISSKEEAKDRIYS
ncbi:MAG: DUF2299 family protein [Candidatus Lokiarchaeota archaeon]|nr:DUF2299 family protein [Candidatus Lokiarchaeota archaeon]